MKSLTKRGHKAIWTESQFTLRTGHAPEQDDMERTNCKQPGAIGHVNCGICHQHNMPVFMCRQGCFINSCLR